MLKFCSTEMRLQILIFKNFMTYLSCHLIKVIHMNINYDKILSKTIAFFTFLLNIFRMFFDFVKLKVKFFFQYSDNF